jgi:hypothetical protein
MCSDTGNRTRALVRRVLLDSRVSEDRAKREASSHMINIKPPQVKGGQGGLPLVLKKKL